MHFSLRCHLCQAGYPAEALWVCNKCLGPLEVVYDYDAITKLISREAIERRPKNLWRYRELLPIQGEPRTGLHSGYTPLVKADRLAARLAIPTSRGLAGRRWHAAAANPEGFRRAAPRRHRRRRTAHD